MKTVKCQTCGYIFSELEVKQARVNIIGYVGNETATRCIACYQTQPIQTPVKDDDFSSVG